MVVFKTSEITKKTYFLIKYRSHLKCVCVGGAGAVIMRNLIPRQHVREAPELKT